MPQHFRGCFSLQTESEVKFYGPNEHLQPFLFGLILYLLLNFDYQDRKKEEFTFAMPVGFFQFMKVALFV